MTAVRPSDDIIAGACEHRLTRIFCPYCRSELYGAIAVQQANRATWSIEFGPDFPHTTALRDSMCHWCETPIVASLDTVYLVASDWVCEGCAHDYEVLTVTDV